jgi:gag-polypeptide of LTR copia-type
LEKQFRQLALQKNQDPEVWLTELEDLRMKLEDMGSSMSDNQFMIHILNNLTSDYELQLALMERRIGDKEKPLTVDEIRDELNLCFERLSMKSASNNESDVLEEQALFSGRFKGVCQNCGMIGHKSVNNNKRRSINNRFSHENNNNNFSGNNSGNNDRNTLSKFYCTYCNKTGHLKKNCFKLKKRKEQLNNNGGTSNYSAQDRYSTDVAFSATSESDNLHNDIWICDSGACGHYCNFLEGLQDVKTINEEITVRNGKTMMNTKVGNLKCRVEQLDGSSLDVTLNEVKYVPDLWINLFSINKALKNGFNLSNKGITICLSKGPVSVSFDRIFPTTNRFLSGIKMSAIHPPIISNANESFKLKNSLDINQFHNVLGHCGADRLQNTANFYCLKLSGQFQVVMILLLQKLDRKISIKFG